jgi:hypothetical protein
MILLAWILIAISGGFLIAGCKPKAKTKPSEKRKKLYEKRRAKIHRIK